MTLPKNQAPLKYAYRRWAVLVDRKFLRRLTAKEQRELARLEKFIDGAEEPFYAPIKRRLETMINAAKNISEMT